MNAISFLILSKDQLLAFAVDLGELFPVVYKYQVEKGKNKVFTADQVRWRNVRRGRYVEFNLVHDRGTKFGLLSGGRTESILLSMPPQAEWFYNEIPEDQSAEGQTLKFLVKGENWCEK